MNVQQCVRLHEWIATGKQAGKIREARTVVLAYCMDERVALPLIVNIVKERMTEEDAQALMEHAIQ